MQVGEKTITEIRNQVEGLCRAWINDLDTAFQKFGGEKFPVTFKSVLDVGQHGGIKIKTGIKFRPEPDIEDTASGTVNEDQITIFESNVVPIRDRRGPVGRPPRYRGLGG